MPNETDIAICPVCHKPKEKVFTLFDQTFRVSCLCDCESNRRDMLHPNLAKQEQELKESAEKELDLLNGKLESATFENAIWTDTIAFLDTFLSNWKDVVSANESVMILGAEGTGKTYTAACAGNRIRSDGGNVLMTDYSTLCGLAHRTLLKEKMESEDIIIVDNVNPDPKRETETENALELLMIRYKERKPVIVTTNMTMDEIKNPSEKSREDSEYFKLCKLLHENCFPVKCMDIEAE